jgi:Tol biopolymer transport system component
MLVRSRPNGEDFQILHTKRRPYVSMQWSPDGQMISFVARGEHGDQVQIIRTDGVARQVTDTPGAYFTPTWSPDGSALVFAGFAEDTGTIYQLTMADGNLRPIYQSTAFIHHVNWDGQWIYFASGNRGQAQLYQMHPDGSDLTYLTDTAFEWELPVSSPISLSLHAEITLLAGLLLTIIGIAPYPIGRKKTPPIPSGRRFVLRD